MFQRNKNYFFCVNIKSFFITRIIDQKGDNFEEDEKTRDENEKKQFFQLDIDQLL